MAPDMGTDEQVMAWFMDTYSMYQGKHRHRDRHRRAGARRHRGRREATGRGVVYLGRSRPGAYRDPAGRRHRHRAGIRQCRQRRCAVAGGPWDQNDSAYPTILPAISRRRASTYRCPAPSQGGKGVLAGFSNQLSFDPRELLTQRCDVLVPAAMERVIDADTAAKLQCRILAEGANGPTMPEADEVLDRGARTSSSSPTSCATPAAWWSSYFEWVQDLQQFFWDEAEVMSKLYHVLDRAFAAVMAGIERDHVSHRIAATAIGVQKVRDAKQVRGLFP